MRDSFYIKYGKRILDLTLTLAGLPVLGPLMLFIAVIIKLTDSGPVLYRQLRVGQNFKPFFLYKFRTMVVNADNLGPPITRVGDKRITPVGRFLRKTKLDELPQLLNVLKGELSLTGPRPEVDKFVKVFQDDYKNVLLVKPGITDFAAIEYRDEERILAQFDNIDEGYIKDVLPKKIQLYHQYMEKISFATDLQILFKTLWRIVR